MNLIPEAKQTVTIRDDGEVLVDGLSAGYVTGTTYLTHRSPLHYMRLCEGFGVSEKVLIALFRRGVKTVRISFKTDYGKKFIYETTLMSFIDSPKTHLFRMRGVSDLQRFMSTTDMVLL